CWPGPYSRLLIGDFGRPQMFWPIRRSTLYFASWRLVIASSLSVSILARSSPKGRTSLGAAPCAEDRALLCPGTVPGTDTFGAEAPAQTTGRETPRGPIGPAKCQVSKAKTSTCQTKRLRV